MKSSDGSNRGMRILWAWVPAALMLAAMAWMAEPAESGNWPNFRGPNFDGSTEAANLPARWTTTDGVLWSVELPGVGAGTPAVWGDRIFLNAADAETGDLFALCLNAADGSERWRRTHGKNQRRGRNDMTAPSPVTDGNVVVFLFGTGELIGYDFDGEQLWARNLLEEYRALSWLFGYGASPLLHQGRLYVQMMRRPTHRGIPEDEPLESFLLALNPETGEDLWKHERDAEARAESWESYITPVPHHGPEAEPQIVLAGADAITGHDAATGRELWRRNFNERRRPNWRLVPTPASDGERIYMPLPRGGTMAAVRPGDDVTPLDENTAWRLTRNAPDVCSPLLYNGRLYVVDGDRHVVTCLNPETGEQVWRGQLNDAAVIRSSPTAGDGKIYFIDERGKVFVLAAGDEFNVLAEIDMGGGQPARSSIVIAGGRLYVRTADTLYCIGPDAE